MNFHSITNQNIKISNIKNINNCFSNSSIGYSLTLYGIETITESFKNSIGSRNDKRFDLKFPNAKNVIFNGVSNVGNIQLSNDITRIQTGTFSNLSNLYHIYAFNVSTLEANAFKSCPNLIRFQSPLTQIDKMAFSYCNNLKHLILTHPTQVANLTGSSYSIGLNASNVNIYVNKNLIDKYKNDYNWKRYFNVNKIQAIQTSSGNTGSIWKYNY